MSTNMTLIEAKTLVATAPSITFSAIPQTYTDLKILVSARDDRAGQPNTDLSLRVGYNGTINTGSIYSARALFGSGAVIASSSSATTYLYLGMANGPTATANTFGNTEIYIPNYTSANYKSVSADGVSENNATTAYAVLNAGLISTSNPITDIQISADYGTGNYQIGSTFYLYGISNVTSTTKATGGIVSSDGTYNYHMFPFSGTFTPTQNITADYLVIAGGGSGGNSESNSQGSASGGGAGGLRSTVTATGGGGTLETALSLTAGTSYTVTVGAGGASQATDGTMGSNGSNSVFSTITSTGGGAGGAGTQGATGGSGGGTSANASGGPSGGAGTANQGFAGGGDSSGIATSAGAGGGGAGAVGTSSSSYSVIGAGGAGVATSISGSSVTYAGGGGGGGNTTVTTGAAGGSGGGGKGGNRFGTNAVAGTANTGGGGGASAANSGTASPSGAGGSGIVIIRYAI